MKQHEGLHYVADVLYVASPSVSADDVLKLQFCLDAMDCVNPFDVKVEVPQSVVEAIKCTRLARCQKLWVRLCVSGGIPTDRLMRSSNSVNQ